MPEIIHTYDEFQLYQTRFTNSLFLIVEYYDASGTEQYSLLYNECLSHPSNFKERLNSGVYRIWTTTPKNIPW